MKTRTISHTRPGNYPAPSSSRRGATAGGAEPIAASSDLSSAKRGRINYGRLGSITREQLEPIWMDSRIRAAEVAAVFGVCESAICDRARRLGLPPRPTRGLRPEARARDAEFRRLWNAGVKLAEIARHFGTSVGYAQRKRRVLGLPPRKARKGAGGAGGFGGITLAQFHEQELGRRMRASA